MKIHSFFRSLFVTACAVLLATKLPATESPRERLSLDAGGKFHLGDIPLDSFPGGQGVSSLRLTPDRKALFCRRDATRTRPPTACISAPSMPGALKASPPRIRRAFEVT